MSLSFTHFQVWGLLGGVGLYCLFVFIVFTVDFWECFVYSRCDSSVRTFANVFSQSLHTFKKPLPAFFGEEIFLILIEFDFSAFPLHQSGFWCQAWELCAWTWRSSVGCVFFLPRSLTVLLFNPQSNFCAKCDAAVEVRVFASGCPGLQHSLWTRLSLLPGTGSGPLPTISGHVCVGSASPVVPLTSVSVPPPTSHSLNCCNYNNNSSNQTGWIFSRSPHFRNCLAVLVSFHIHRNVIVILSGPIKYCGDSDRGSIKYVFRLGKNEDLHYMESSHPWTWCVPPLS